MATRAGEDPEVYVVNHYYFLFISFLIVLVPVISVIIRWSCIYT
jgi:hypothetical protein